ncbi:MAG TPA: tellurite resistance TerB family protein [Kofleriaceae bacterium]|nr:tellurite resistance TerB family protein [Kofleriaceae bacterium]
MGFFDSLKKKPLKVDDQQLLLEAMLCVAFADGDDQYEETQLVRAFAATLPEFKNADAYEVYEKAEKSVKLYGAMTRVKELNALTSDSLKQKAFLLAMDIALSSGEIDDGEEAVLGAMAETLRIAPADADRIASVLMIKYAT